MKKIIVQKVCQKDLEFYSMVVDPRLIAKVRKKYTAGEQQDGQRPWVERKVKDIAGYVAGQASVEGRQSLGIIPNAPIINVKGKLKVKTETIDDRKQYYIELPDTDDEIAECEKMLEIIDGQHRVIAFDEKYLDPEFSDNFQYEMIFSVFNNITDNQRKELFMVTNEKQDKVDKTLLRYIKKSLGLLQGEEAELYDLVDGLNNESSCPLYRRIILDSTKIRKGYNGTQMSKIFSKYGVKRFYDTKVKTSNNQDTPAKTFITIVSNYLSAWENCSNVSFQRPGTDTITKMCGLRYLFTIFPDICDKILASGKKLSCDNFEEIIKVFPDALQLENVKCVFCDDDSESPDIAVRKSSFSGESGTVELAKADIEKVITYENSRTGGSLL